MNPLRSKVPEDRPFVLRTDPVRHVLRHHRGELSIFVPFGILFAAGGIWLWLTSGSTVSSSRYEDLPTPLVAGACILLGLYLAILQPVNLARRARGAIMSADGDGVFLRPNLLPEQAVYLPWERIEFVAVRDHRGPNLCLKPRDRTVDADFDIVSTNPVHNRRMRIGQEIAQRRRTRKLDTNIFVPLGGVATPVADILRTLQTYAAGRTAFR